jgi:hypothetical protein
MSAPITKHALAPHPDDDPDHPIPSLGTLDVVTVLSGGGADLIIVVASPLIADRRSLSRLQDKIEAYLHHILSPEFQAEAGEPNSGNTTILVKLHPRSAPEVYDFLERSKGWVSANRATLRIETLDVAVH